MITKFKLSVMAGALALVAAGQASAAINGVSTTGNGDLILSVWDTTSLTSYTSDLGISLNSTLLGPTVNGGTSFLAGQSGPNNTWYADATMTSFLSGVAALDPTYAALSWNVVAMDSTLTGSGVNAYRILSTSTSGSVGAASNTTLKTYNSAPDVYMSAVNVLAGSNSSVATDSVTGGFAYAGGTSFANNFGGKANFTNTAGLGQSQNFYSLATTTGINAETVNQFANTTFTLQSNGNLVAAVPEPGEWALMLSGFGLIGFIASRRKNQNTSMTFA